MTETQISFFGVVYDDRMMEHRGHKAHPEKPERIQAIYEHLNRNDQN